jgi:alkylhydroperoxidase family enzyme
VLETGGRALITFHDARHPNAEPVRDQLAAEGWAVRFDSLEGSNHLASFVTAEVLADLARPHLELIDVRASDTTACGQAIAVLRRV